MKIKYTTLVLSFTLFLCATAIGIAQTTQLSSDDFNNGFGNWNDGGGDCFLDNYDYGCLDDSGKILLRDNSNASSSLFSDTYDLTNYNEITIDFEYRVASFENNENWYIEFSSDNGFNYSIISNYIVDVDFTENVCYNETITIYALDHTFNNQNRIRFRADASGNSDYLYLDDIVVEGFSSGTAGTDILFSEDFSGYPENIEIPDDVDTITGSGTSATNPNGVSWSLTGPESANEIKLHHDGGQGDSGHIHTKKVNGTATFETDPITVSGYTGLNLKIYEGKFFRLLKKINIYIFF